MSLPNWYTDHMPRCAVHQHGADLSCYEINGVRLDRQSAKQLSDWGLAFPDCTCARYERLEALIAKAKAERA